MTKVSTVLGAIGLATAVAVGGTAQAEDYPNKPITYIIPFGPGGESDITARMQQKFFPEHAGVDVVVQYKPGAGGAQGWSQLNSMEADGYTIMGTNVPHIILQPMISSPGYETDNVNTVYFFHYTPNAIIVREDSQFQTFQDLVDYAKANPGALTWAGSGSNSANHLMARQLDQELGMTTTYIPFKGTGAAVTALLGGQVMAGSGYSTIGVNHADETRVLAVAAEERLPSLPDAPTLKELGYDLVGGAYRGMGMPQDVPEERQQKFAEIAASINADPEFREMMQDAGFVLVDIGPEKMDDFMSRKQAEYDALAEQMGIKKSN